MSLFFPYAGCPTYHCYRFIPPLLASFLPLQVIDAFLVTGFVCQVLTATLLWHIAERCGVSKRAAVITVGWYWAVWGPMPMLRDAMLIADPVQALWIVAALLLLLDGRYLLALPVLVSGAGVKESVLTVPAIYTAYLMLSGADIRSKIPWLATLIAVPAIAWVATRRLLLTVFQYAPPGDSNYLAHPYLFGLWLRSLGAWPRNLGVALVYVFAGFGAAWILGALGLWRGDRRRRALAAASAPAMAFLALYQEPHRAVACFPWAVLVPAAAYIEPLPAPLIAALLLANAAFTLRMSATVAWLPPMPRLLAVLLALTACCVFLREWRGHRSTAENAAAAPTGGRLIAAAIAAVAAALIVVSAYDVSAARRFTPLAMALPRGIAVADDDSGAPGLAVSPDGEWIAFVGIGTSAMRQLWMRPTDAETAAPLTGTERASAPFWSPDGTALGFFADDKLKVIELAAQRVRVLADAPAAHGGAWSSRGLIVFASTHGLDGVDARGGAVRPAARIDARAGSTSYRWPGFLPDGAHVLFTERNLTGDQQWIRLGDVDTLESHRVIADASAPAFAPPGIVFYVRYGGLVAQAFDTRRREFEPLVQLVRQQVANAPGSSRAAVAVSGRTLAFATATVESLNAGAPHASVVRWYDRAGRPSGDLRRLETPTGVALSPDERSIAMWALADGSPRLEVSRFSTTFLTEMRTLDGAGAVWSPDGTRVAFTATNASRTEWQLQSAAIAGGAPQVLLTSAQPLWPMSWSPDGRVLIYLSRNVEQGDLWALTLAKDATPVPIARGAAHAAFAQFSPDGRWMSYTALNGSGRDVFVQRYPPTGEKWIVSTDGGEQARWNADGRELIYVSSNRHFMSVDVDTEQGFHARAPRRLFDARIRRSTDDMFHYAISRDGQRLLVDAVDGPEPSARVTLATDWRGSLALLDRE
jgi:Tol biopolymer transport system component